MRRLAAVGLLLVACGGSKAKPDALIFVPDAPADAAPDAPPPPKNLVTVQVFGGTPSLVSYRDGQGPWTTPSKDSQGYYDLMVTSDYQLVIACADQTGFDSILFDQTYAEVSSQFVFCDKNLPTGPAMVAATGQMTQAGTVDMYATASSATAAWNFTLNVPTGTHDLVAYDTANVLIRRGVAITGPTTLPTVDVSTDGTAMTPIALTINGRVSGDTLTTELDWLTDNDFAAITGTSDTMLVPPSSLVSANDFEGELLTIRTPTTFRYVDTQFDAAQTTFELMPVLSGITYSTSANVVVATWGTLPPYRGIELDLFTGSDPNSSMQSVQATPGWLAAHGQSEIAFDATPPGYDAAWHVDPTGPYVRDVNVFDSSGAVSYGTELLEAVNGATLPERVRRPARQRRAR